MTGTPKRLAFWAIAAVISAAAYTTVRPHGTLVGGGLPETPEVRAIQRQVYASIPAG